METIPWMVSMHGGHSSAYCDHAFDELRMMLDAAIDAGYHTFGVSEHAPRWEDRFLYENERVRGWTAEKTIADFDSYVQDIQQIAEEYRGRLNVVRGLEAEVVPAATWLDRTTRLRDRRNPDGSGCFDYVVGSVHFVREVQIDGEPEDWLAAVELCGGVEELANEYYATVADMIQKLKPDIVGHLDLIKKNCSAAGREIETLNTMRVGLAIDAALEAMSAAGSILDLNAAGWRKGLGEPYPSRSIVKRAAEMQIPFCFGDDSHRVSQVGERVPEAREYLLSCGVESITYVIRGGGRSCAML